MSESKDKAEKSLVTAIRGDLIAVLGLIGSSGVALTGSGIATGVTVAEASTTSLLVGAVTGIGVAGTVISAAALIPLVTGLIAIELFANDKTTSDIGKVADQASPFTSLGTLALVPPNIVLGRLSPPGKPTLFAEVVGPFVDTLAGSASGKLADIAGSGAAQIPGFHDWLDKTVQLYHYYSPGSSTPSNSPGGAARLPTGPGSGRQYGEDRSDFGHSFSQSAPGGGNVDDGGDADVHVTSVTTLKELGISQSEPPTFAPTAAPDYLQPSTDQSSSLNNSTDSDLNEGADQDHVADADKSDDSDKNDSDKNDSDKNDSDKNDSDKNDSDKNDSDKNDSDKDDSGDHES